MEMKVVVPSPPPSLDMLDMNKNINFNNNSTSNNNSSCSTPYISAPSSPQRQLNFFYSAPASPRHSSSNSFFSNNDFVVDHFSFLSDDGPPSPSAVVPFDWESKPGIPKSTNKSGDEYEEDEDDDFEFEFSGQLDKMVRPSLSSADELFDGGKIRPLKPPPVMVPSSVDSPRSPRSPISKFRDALSPKQRKIKRDNNYQDPFEAALQNTRKSEEIPLKLNDQLRGRSKNLAHSRANSRKGISRSLSPLRVSEFALLHQQEFDQTQNSNGGSSSTRGGSRKWRLRDFLLFRSASEGRATTGKDPLRKYLFLSSGKKVEDEAKNGSFRSTTSSIGDGSVSRRRGQVSAHELHYTTKRAVSEELKKKTSLPYKHGLLGCLGFNPALNEISKAFGSFGGNRSS